MKMAKLFIAGIVIIGAVTFANACPRIISRAEWGARAASTAALSTFPPTHVVIHHSATQGCTTQAACSNLVRSFQNTHMNINRWADIGYNFLIGGDGQIYQGRGWGRTGAHAVNWNARSIGICFIGTFTSGLPPNSAINAAHALISCGVNSGQIARNYRLIGHRQVSATECPGTALFNQIRNWPNFGNP